MKTAEIEYLENFKMKVFEIVFGKGATNKKYSDSKVLEKLKEFAKNSTFDEKYTISQVFHAASIVREQMSQSQFDSDDFDDSEFEGMVSEVLGYHWDFQTFEKRLEIVTNDESAIYRKVKNMSGMQGGQAENEILDNICKNNLADQPLFDELESYLIPETHEAEIMEEI